MKIKGKKLQGPNVCELYLPRGEEILIIRAQAVLEYTEFNVKVPEPKPPIKIVRGGGKQPDFDNPMFLREMEDYGKRKMNWMILQSLKAWEGLEWETVDLADPNTWHLYEEELKDAGFSEIEKQRIVALVFDANCLNEKRLEEARERFLFAQTVERNGAHSSSQKDVRSTTSSGEPVKDSESDRPAS